MHPEIHHINQKSNRFLIFFGTKERFTFVQITIKKACQIGKPSFLESPITSILLHNLSPVFWKLFLILVPRPCSFTPMVFASALSAI
jgi:hypothetical protein